MKTMIDPPYGWKYGFPREIPSEIKDIRSWLIDCGYPESEVDFALRYCRTWEIKEQ